MGALVRAFAALAAIVGTALSAVCTWSLSSFAPLAAVTALMMGGTGHPLMFPDSDEYIQNYLGAMGDRYVQPSLDRWGTSADPLELTRRVAVYTPEHFWPATGTRTFDDSVSIGVANLSACISGGRCMYNPNLGDAPGADGPLVVFGYSQSAQIATRVKRALIDFYQRPEIDWADAPDASFVFIGNPARPNGGILERLVGLSIPFFGISFDGATPTDSTGSDGNQHLSTIDISKQYDAISDFPLYPLNLLATLNAFAGYFTEHGSYTESLDNPSVIDQGSYGDTHYYLIPAGRLPILKLFNGFVPDPILTALDAPLRTIIELGYDRTLSPGAPTSARLLRFTPLSDVIAVARAVAIGIDDGLAQASGDPSFRPLGTTALNGPFGVQRSVENSEIAADTAKPGGVEAIERAARRFDLGNSSDPKAKNNIEKAIAKLRKAPADPESETAAETAAPPISGEADEANVKDLRVALGETAPRSVNVAERRAQRHSPEARRVLKVLRDRFSGHDAKDVTKPKPDKDSGLRDRISKYTADHPALAKRAPVAAMPRESADH